MAGARALWVANGMKKEMMGKPIIAIVNSFTQFVPGHTHLHEIGQQVKAEIEKLGCFAAEFNTIAIDDGIAMGHDGMLYSLPSRDIIADSVEYMVNAHKADAMVCISNCDKITPGMLMAAMRLNIPTVFVSGGPMEAGEWNNRHLDLIDAMIKSADSSVSDEEVAQIENNACPGCGCCSGMFTANSMNCLNEAIGLGLPGNGTILATHANRTRLFKDAAALIVKNAYKYYEEALQGFTEIEPNADFMVPYENVYQKPVDMRSYIWYRIGKMHCYGLGTEQNYAQAFGWFLKSAEEGNKFGQYTLGNLYYYGNGTDKDLSQAFLWYQKSSSQGQPYASYSIAQMYNKGEYVSQSEENVQRYYKNALSGFLELESKDQTDDNLYYKLGSMFKKGLGTDIDMDKAIDYFKRSAEMNNTNAKRTLALEYILGKHLEQNIEKGLEMLTECADSGDTLSCYKLGKIYFKGEIVYKDLNMAEKYFLKASQKENRYALYSLGTLYLEKEKYSLHKAVEYFDKAVQYDEIKPYAAYSLAKIMLDNNPYHDSEKAVSILELAAMENEWASFLLGRLYLYGTDDIQKDKEKALEWLKLSAEQGNEYAQNMIDNIHSFENAVVANTIFGLFVNLSKCIADDYNRKYKSNRMSADRKLRRIIQQKKQALGLKEEHLQNQELY